MTPVIGTGRVDDVIIRVKSNLRTRRTGETPDLNTTGNVDTSGVIAAKQQPAEDHGGLRST
jgi:hypothetical protein